MHKKLTWSLPARGLPAAPSIESIAFRVEWQENRRWKAYSNEIEAALSLWLYSIYKKETSNKNAEEEQNKSPDSRESAKDDRKNLKDYGEDPKDNT